MSTTNVAMLAPMVQKLARRSQLGSIETEALLGLPYRRANSDAATYLIREGDKTDNCILLLSGFAYRSKTTGDGARQILSLHLAGDVVGLQDGLLVDADHSVQALTPVEVAHIPHQAMLNVAEAYPAVGRAFWRDTLLDASIFREWILNVGQRNARQRISHLLCELALRQEEAGLCKGPHYQWPMTQEQIGDATGLTPIHVNRTIQGMRRDGLIGTSGRSVTVLDWSQLQAAGDFRSAYLHQASTFNPAPPLAA